MLDIPNPLKLVIVGGASGVGKTTIIRAMGSAPTYDTGSLFKSHLGLMSRDDVRKGDWSVCEKEVTKDLSDAVIGGFALSRAVIVDTHFAAKIFARNYRIGLKKELLCEFARNIFAYSEQLRSPLEVQVVLVTCSPHALLRRRRLDHTRDRELVPSDCFNDLRANRIRSHDYIEEIRRAGTTQHGELGCPLSHHIIENTDQAEAASTLERILGGR